MRRLEQPDLREQPTGPEGPERREYFRILCFARVRLRVLEPADEPSARARIRARRVPHAFTPGALEEAGLGAEQRLSLGLLKSIALSLERIERQIDRVGRPSGAADGELLPTDAPLEISLSASGFAGPFGLDLADKTLVEAQLDLGDAGLPMIAALARVVASPDQPSLDRTAFAFEELVPDDRERIVQLALRSQTQALRDERSGERQ